MADILRALAAVMGLSQAREAADEGNAAQFEKGMLLYLNSSIPLPEPADTWAEAFGNWSIDQAMDSMRNLPPDEAGALFGTQFGAQQAIRFPHLAVNKETPQ